MVAPALGVHLRGAAEFPPDHDRNIFVEPRRMQIINQRRQSIVQLRKDFAGLPKIA